MSRFYTLDSNEVPVATPDPVTFATWMAHHEDAIVVGKSHIGKAFVSTVFLGIDVSFHPECPLLWETRVFNYGTEEFCTRYGTLADATEGHKRTVLMVTKGADLT